MELPRTPARRNPGTLSTLPLPTLYYATILNQKNGHSVKQANSFFLGESEITFRHGVMQRSDLIANGGFG